MKHFYVTIRKFTFLLSVVLGFSIEGLAQVAEREPNNTFETADTISKGSVKMGSVNNLTDPYDYFVAVFAADGTLKIYVNGTNSSVANGYLYMYGFDGRKASGQVFGKYISNNSNVLPGTGISDTITLYGQAADTFYFRLETSGTFNYSLSYDIVDVSETDTEPNGTFETATSINQLEEKKGHISYVKNGVPDQYDYYKTKLGADGTVKIYVEGKNNSGGNGYLYMYGFDKRKGNGQVFGQYISSSNIANGATINDTITLYGRASDSFYFRLEAAGGFTYSLKYDMTEINTSDIEPNDIFENAITMNATDEKTGNISYVKSGTADTYDYYRTILPIDGTLKIYVEGTNLSGANGYLYIYGFDKRKANGQVFGTYISGSSNIPYKTTITDSIVIYGVLADTFYFRVQSVGAFKYKLRYVVVQNSVLDEEPNNTFEQALPMRQGVIKIGQVGYTSGGVTDTYDYYKTMLPADGTMKIYVKGTNNGGANGYLYLYGFDRRAGNGQVFGKYISNNSNISTGTTIYDTITLYGRATDSFYFRLESAGAWSYSLSYDIIDTSEIDIEPNDLFDEALAINPQQEKKGHISYVKNGIPDQYDYYRTVFPADGTLKIYMSGTNNSGSNGYLYMYVFDQRKGNGQILGKYISSSSIPAGTTIYDTTLIYGRAADTFYFRLESAGAFGYSLKYEILDTSARDAEPNNTFETALPIIPREIKKGHIGYLRTGISDQYDFYKAVLPQDGTLKIYVNGTNNSGNNGYLYMYGFDRRKGSGQVFGKYIANNSNAGSGTTIYDTIFVNCRAADTFYFRLESAGAWSYNLSYDMVDVSPNDTEPNNTFETSLPATLDTTYKGHIGYVNYGGQDNDDYYKTVLPAKGTVKIIVEGTNTSGAGGYIYLYGYDKLKGNGQILAKYLSNNSNVSAGATIRDTIVINCVSTDTFYLRWTSAGCFKYTFRFEYIDRQPKASMKYERLGNTVGFRPQLANATSFIWNFGDGTTSTLQYPMKTYTPGFWVAKLIVTNSVCNYTDTAQQTFEIKGVEYYTPDSSGSGGDAIMKIFGGGLDTATKVTLKKGSIEVTPVRKFTNAVKNQLNAIFDLHNAIEGVYDVIITVPGLAPLVYPNGFKINAFRYPYTWSEVVAPSRWRTNVDTKIKLVVGNKGNVNASGVLVTLIWPKSVDLKFDTKWFKPPATGNYTITTPDTTFNFKWQDIQHFYSDSFNTITAIDSFAGKPYNGFMRLILIPKVAGGSTYEIPLIARSSQVAAQNFITFTFKPNIFGSCPNGSWMDMSENLAVEAADGLDKLVSLSPVLEKSPVGWLTKATKGTTKHMANLGQAMGAFYNYATGVTNSIDESLPADYIQNVDAGNAQVTSALIDVAVDKLVEKGADNFMKGQTNQLNNFIAKNPNATASTFNFAIDNLNNINDIRNLIKNTYKTGKDLKDLKAKLDRLSQLVNDCPDLKKQVEDLKKEINKDMNQKDPKETKTNSVTSFDPNAIYGPAGQGINKYVNRNDRQHFLVTFENVDSATAAAQIVRVVDTLDKALFDLNTFEFGNVTVGTQNFEVPKGRKEFVMEQMLTPAMSVRINAKLDTVMGIVTWQFTAIDPVTKDIPVFEGFLPPNKAKPEGEGSGSYTVYPRQTIADGTVFLNRASIVFDFNLPVFTNTWENIADVPPPVSSVLATVTAGDSIIHLNFTGNDAKSGTGYYNLYVSENNGPWQAFGGGATDTLSLKGEPGKTYGFYSVANDKVGNLEEKLPAAETVVSLSNPLTINLGNISATNVGKRNRVNWNTLSEDIGDYFIAERSSNTMQFAPFNTVPAWGTASAYQVFDDTPVVGRNYYRLRLYRPDGSYKLSKVVSAIVSDPQTFIIKTFPNPLKDMLTIAIQGMIEGAATISVINAQGSTIQTINGVKNTTEVNMTTLAKGVYFIRYIDKNRSKVIKVFKN